MCTFKCPNHTHDSANAKFFCTIWDETNYSVRSKHPTENIPKEGIDQGWLTTPLVYYSTYLYHWDTELQETKGGRQIFKFFFNIYVRYSALLHLPPLRFHCVGGSWDRTQTVATTALAVRRPITMHRIDLIHKWQIMHISSVCFLSTPRTPGFYGCLN
jgi:hypothetical protein